MAPGGSPALVVTPGMLTAQDVGALRSRASVLSNQLNSANGRRQSLRNELRSATGADRAGLEKRLSQLDDRISRLEGDIDENGKALASLPAQRAMSGAPAFNNPRGNRMDNNAVPIAIVFTIFVLSPIALSVARLFWKRGSAPKQAPANVENTERMMRMEQAIDSIAIEVERVSEGQRFVTRLLAEGRPSGALGQGGAERMAVPMGEKSAAPR
ncbi:MAG: hypothetical protein ABJE47_22415 [bacterium]